MNPAVKKADALARCRVAMDEGGIDALVAASVANVGYVAGHSFVTQVVFPEERRLALVAIPRDGEPVFIVGSVAAPDARAQSWLTEIRVYREFAEKPIEVLAEVLGSLGVAKGRVGIEKGFLVAEDYEDLRRSLPGAELIAADDVFDHIRVIKTVEEIDLLSRAAIATEGAIAAAFAAVVDGTSDEDIAHAIIQGGLKRGGDEFHHLLLAVGGNNKLVHGTSGRSVVRRGSVLRADFGMYWNHYISDLARTVFVSPSERQKDLTKSIAEVQHNVIADMRPGVLASALYEKCKRECARVGLRFDAPHCGHSIGLQCHEKPMLHPFDHTPLQANMLINVEPWALDEREGMMHIEDLVLITETGSRIVSRGPVWHPLENPTLS